MARKKKDKLYYDNLLDSIVFWPIRNDSLINSTVETERRKELVEVREEAVVIDDDVTYDGELSGDGTDQVRKPIEKGVYTYRQPLSSPEGHNRPVVPISQRSNYLSTPVSRAAQSNFVHRNIQPSALSSTSTLYKGIHVHSDRLVLYRHEVDFFTEIDVTRTFLENVSNTVKDEYIDLGECGLVILKYKTSGNFDEDVYESCAQTLASYNVKTMSSGSYLGKISPDVFQLAQLFYMKVQYMKAPVGKEKDAMLNFNQSFNHVTSVFRGRYPFKEQLSVSTQAIGCIQSDTKRGISTVIKHVLAQILDDPRGHQLYALRVQSGKNDKLQNLPSYVFEFMKDFCLMCFGYPRRSRFPNYTYDQLMREDAGLCARLGKNRDEGVANFPQFQRDVQKFIDMVAEKLQRVLHDLRTTFLQDVYQDVDGFETYVREFVQETIPGKQDRKNAKKVRNSLVLKSLEPIVPITDQMTQEDVQEETGMKSLDDAGELYQADQEHTPSDNEYEMIN